MRLPFALFLRLDAQNPTSDILRRASFGISWALPPHMTQQINVSRVAGEAGSNLKPASKQCSGRLPVLGYAWTVGLQQHLRLLFPLIRSYIPSIEDDGHA
jgi:hypothetical protein